MTPKPLDLDAVEALCDAATAGPWSADVVEPHDMVVWAPERFEGDESPPLIMNIGGSFARVGDVCGSEADTHFIAAARTLVPALVTRLRALDAENARLRADAERYQWLKAADPGAVCSVAYRVDAACEYNEPDACVDAARTAGA